MIVRRFRPADAEAVHAVFVRAVREGAAGRYTEAERLAWAPETRMPQDWPARLAGLSTFVAEADGAVAGFMALDAAGLLDMAFVLPEWRGRGMADALHAEVQAEARRQGHARLTTEASHLARSFFRRHGWTEVARQEVERRGVRLVNFRMFLDLTERETAMAVRFLNPGGVAAPASRYSHVALAEGAAQIAAFAGQVGVRPDGTVPEGLEAQLDQCFANLDACLAAAGLERGNLLRITVYVTDPSAGAVATYRARRDAWIGEGLAPAATYLVVAALAAPALLCEVEALAAG